MCLWQQHLHRHKNQMASFKLIFVDFILLPLHVMLAWAVDVTTLLLLMKFSRETLFEILSLLILFKSSKISVFKFRTYWLTKCLAYGISLVGKTVMWRSEMWAIKHKRWKENTLKWSGNDSNHSNGDILFWVGRWPWATNHLKLHESSRHSQQIKGYEHGVGMWSRSY